MLRLALRGALARRLRLALTAASVVLGVAFVSGTLVLTDTLNATFDTIFGNAEHGVSVVVRGVQSFSATGPDSPGLGPERTLVPDRVLRVVRTVPGVASAVGVADGYAQLVYRGHAVVNGGAPNLGTAWVGDVAENPLHLVTGRAPQAPGEVVVDSKSAAKYRLRPGTPVEVVVSGRAVRATVVGVVTFGNSTLGGATITAFVPRQAQQLFLGATGVWSTVQAAADPGVSQATLRARVQQALAAAAVGGGVVVETKNTYAAEQANQVKKQLKFFDILLLVFAFISVFVAVFIIFNTFTVLVAQRTRELALLRALGASRRQVLADVVLEAGVVGVVAGGVGLGVGVLVAAGLRALLGALSGGGFDTVALQLRSRTVVVAMLVGVVVTVAAAVIPAVRASRVPPVAAMRDDFTLPVASLRRRTRLGLVTLVIGAVLLALGVTGGTPVEIGFGAFAMFRGAIALSPVLSRPVVGGLGRLLPRFWGVPGRLARENALRNPRRTAATASALMIGIALTTTMSVLAASITTSAAAEIDKSVGADFIITAKAFAPVSGAVAAAVRGVPGVAAVSEFRQGAMKVAGSVTAVQGATAGSVLSTLRLSRVAGSLSLGPGQLLVSKKVATAHHWAAGRRVSVEFSLTGRQSLRIAGVYADNPIAGDYLIGLGTYDANFRNRLDLVVAVKATSVAALGTARTGLAKALRPFPAVQLRDQTEFKQDQKRQINQVLVFVLALLVLSLLIAWLGIVNTLALSVFERTREIGLLRAVGMAARQVRRMVRLEAVVIAVFGALLGVVLGLGYGAALVQALHSQGIDQTSVPVRQLIGYLVVGAVAGVTAAWWPARRASRLDVLRAIAAE